MTDALEKNIRELFSKKEPLEPDDVTYLLLEMLSRIQELEKAIGAK